jgi:methionine-rich copper-binding protein CopC
MEKVFTFPVVCILLFGGLWFLPQPAFAHAEFSGSFPAAGAELALPPAEVLIVFTSALAEGGHSIAVTDARGERVDRNDSRRDPRDTVRRSLIVSLRAPLSPGIYTVTWRNTGSDGHSFEGSFQFAVREAQGFAWWLWTPLFTLLVLCAVAILRRGRNQNSEATHSDS